MLSAKDRAAVGRIAVYIEREAAGVASPRLARDLRQMAGFSVWFCPGIFCIVPGQEMSKQRSDIRRRVAGNIGRAIADSQLSVAEISRRMPGITSEKTIRRWRNGETRPSEESLAALAEVVGVSDLTWFYLPHNEEVAA